MPFSKNKYINFSLYYELNYHLIKVNKKQSESNRALLKTMGKELKGALQKHLLTHKEFHDHIGKEINIAKLEG